VDEERSYEPITLDDLARLEEITAVDRRTFFISRPEYAERMLCTALCQGAGQHYVEVAAGNGKPHGVKDFDVWTFFSTVPGAKFPANRRLTHADFGPSKFGRWTGGLRQFRRYQGRRVDMIMRGLPVPLDADPAEAVRAYLTEARTTSARLLATKGAVLISPADLRGTVIWPPVAVTAR
jgi:hypothetical protein